MAKKMTVATGTNSEVVKGVDEVRLDQLREEFDFTLNQRDSNVFSRIRKNYEARMCLWAGKSDDGRKWTPRANEEQVFPWEGASDAEVNLVDSFINKDVDFLMVLWNRLKLGVVGTEFNDEKWARRMTWFLRWMVYEQMLEADTENDLLANYLLERGSAVMGVFWNRQRQMGYEEIDLEQVTGELMNRLTKGGGGADGAGDFFSRQDAKTQSEDQSPSPLPMVPQDQALGYVVDFVQKVQQPGFEEEAARVLNELYPGVNGGEKRLVKVVEDLRLHGYAKFPRALVIKNRPRLYALAPNEDVFISPDAIDMEDGQVHWVETMREAKLQEKATTLGWDPNWTAKMIETQRGNISYGQLLFNHRFQLGLGNLLQPNRGYLDVKKLFLVVHSYRRLVNEDGVPGIYYTVWNPNMAANNGSGHGSEQLYAQHELLNYEHGKMPFVLFRREMRSRRIDDARGYGEIASTWQMQVKNEWDSRIDRSSIATLPPSFHPPGQAPDKWGPGVGVPTSRRDAYGFLEAPRYDPGSREVEESVKMFAKEYFGFLRDEEHQLDAINAKQRLADRWLKGHKQVATQVMQLCQQFMDEEFYYRVVGDQQSEPIHATREDIQGEFDLSVSFNVQDMDPEHAEKKLQLLGQVMAMDVSGAVDRNKAMQAAFEVMDPNLGERLLRSPENASLAEVEDEKTVFVKLLAGVPTDVKPGQAFQLRLQTLQNLLQMNQTAQEILKNNEQVREVFKEHVQQLQLQIDQQQNAVTGRGGPMFAAKTNEGG